MRRIAHISDLHFGRHDPSVSEGLLSAIERARPDLVAVTGDLTQRARRREFRMARAFLDRIEAPVLVVPGNHDVPLYNIYARLFRPHARFERFITPDRRPRYVDDEIAVLGLNTAWRKIGAHGRFIAEHLAAIREGFADVGGNVTRMLVTHHPLLGIEEGRTPSAAHGARAALRELAAAGVTLLLAGHEHRPYSVEGAVDYLDGQRSMLIIQAGTAVSTRLRGGANSFNVIDIDGARLDCTPQVWETGGFRRGVTARFSSVDGRWRLAAPPPSAAVPGVGRFDILPRP
jgi:3',5'-cyclic AMP phosphodiesterase CpdA